LGAVIEPKLLDAEVERAKSKPTANSQAYDFLLRALPTIHTLDPGGIDPAIVLLDKAIALDPSYARAFALKARLQVRRIFTIGADPLASSMTETVRLARLAVEKGRDDPDVLWMASFAVTMAGGDLQGGIALIDRSLALNPNCAEALAHGAMVYAFSGDRAMTIAHAERALRLNPIGRATYNIYFARGVLEFVCANYEGCRDWMTQALREMPMFAPALQYQAASLSKLGRSEEAQNVVRRLLAVTPRATLARVRLIPTYYAERPDADRILDAMLDGLRQAGLPEG
jgi:tetratricopeptide (TPR) repeat protein